MGGPGAPLDSSLVVEGMVEDEGDERCSILHRLKVAGNTGQLAGARELMADSVWLMAGKKDRRS